ncbi:MAG: hypothetical protein H7Z14_19180 [Anaerolineae bacterium]|nr:hypothetical protein [Phycisphaerae bacterium]
MTTLERTTSTERGASTLWRVGFCLVIALLALIAAERIVMVDTLDPDAFWHLRVADQLAREGIRPIVDELSYNSVRTPWTPYSWLAELGMRGIWNSTGLPGAVITHILMAMTMVLASALACSAAAATTTTTPTISSQRALPIIIAVLLAAMWTQPFTAFRPVSAAFVLLMICAWLLLRDRRMDQRSRTVWLVPPIIALMVNVHFFAILVPCWIGALLTGALIERDRRGARRYALLLISTALALLATPMLAGMIRAMAGFAGADPLVASGQISEMTYLWRNPWGVALAVLAAATVGWLIVKRRDVRVGEWIWLGGMTLLAARYARFTPLFAMLAAPLLARTLPAMNPRVLGMKIVWLMLALVIAVTAFRVIDGLPPRGASPSVWLNRHPSEQFGYPCEAADYLDAHVSPRSGHLINGFNWGGYLAWRLPQFKVMADARTQLYSAEFCRRFAFGDADTTRAALRELIATQGADAAILPRDDQHLRPRLLELDWTIAHQDDRVVVLTPPPRTSVLPSGDRN